MSCSWPSGWRLRIAKRHYRPHTEPCAGHRGSCVRKLDVRLNLRRDDEIGLLINSFNHMVSGLKEGKETLQKAYVKSDRRALMENILANINSGVVFLLMCMGRILTITNVAACSILNVKAEDVINKNYRN